MQWTRTAWAREEGERVLLPPPPSELSSCCSWHVFIWYIRTIRCNLITMTSLPLICIEHCELGTMHLALCIEHYALALCIEHYELGTMHWTLCIEHYESALCIGYYALGTTHLSRTHYALHTTNLCRVWDSLWECWGFIGVIPRGFLWALLNWDGNRDGHLWFRCT